MERTSKRERMARLIDEAEEEECKEVLLAYVHLLHADEALTARALDLRVEAWLHERFEVEVDFEVADGLAKLEHFGLVTHEGEHYRARPLLAALGSLEARWQAL